MDYDKLWYEKLKIQAKTDYKMFKNISKSKFNFEANK